MLAWRSKGHRQPGSGAATFGCEREIATHLGHDVGSDRLFVSRKTGQQGVVAEDVDGAGNASGAGMDCDDRLAREHPSWTSAGERNAGRNVPGRLPEVECGKHTPQCDALFELFQPRLVQPFTKCGSTGDHHSEQL